MSIQGRTITIGKTVYTLEELSIDRTLRLTDIVFRVLDKMSDEVQAEFTEFVQNYRANNEIIITSEMLADEDAKASELEDGLTDQQKAAAGELRPLHTTLINSGYDPKEIADDKPAILSAEPSQEEIIGFFLPKAYAVARPDLLTLFALILAENAKMAEAENQEGGVDAYLETIANKVKHEGKTSDLISLLTIAWEVAKDEFERIKSSGNLPAPLAGLASSQASPSDEPTPSI